LRGYYPDSKVFGLTIFLGAKSSVWRFRQQSRTKGKRSSVFKTLGNWPAMDVDEARKQALMYSGAVAAGTAAPGKRQAMPFRTAFENHLAHLKALAEAKGKPPRWWLNACKLSEAHIRPQWSGWMLAEMSANPRRQDVACEALEDHPDNRRPLRSIDKGLLFAKKRGLIARSTRRTCRPRA
jgi:hypothetical protein